MTRYLLFYKPLLTLLLIGNLLGTIYGYIWYIPQLKETPLIFKVFVPDSPTASLFFCIVLILYLFNKSNGLVELLAFITLFKYGIWAVIMNLLMFIELEQITLMGSMLIISHLIMAIEGLLFLPRYSFNFGQLFLVMLWVFHNDFIDYVIGHYPKYPVLEDYFNMIGYISLILGFIAMIIAFFYWHKRYEIMNNGQKV